MQKILPILILFLVMLILHAGIRRVNKTTAWSIFLALPLSLAPYWISVNGDAFGLFEWGKLYSVLATTLWLVAIRFTNRCSDRLAAFGLRVLFGLNILEAVAVDFATFEPASLMNAASGILLVAVMGESSCTVHRNGRFADLEFEGLGRAWIMAFTLWNLTFLLINYPIIFGHHLAVLGVPLLVGLCRPQLWLQARLSLLALDLMALATFSPFLIPWLDTTGIGDLHFELFAAATSLIACLLVALVKVCHPSFSDGIIPIKVC